MEALAKSDIFFVLTGFSVVIVTLMMLVVLFYVIKILRHVEEITDHVRTALDMKNIVHAISSISEKFNDKKK